ncbi:MAG TPA: UDP-3-O-(3-hydroxymyristoyl)glucosamine N-acyltransferase [Terriglobales bacterium]|nr:UDP-3-O-(3-hydroxymyristoyl)glucosamine N-acyltransferase [Terriglobales bacterium]
MKLSEIAQKLGAELRGVDCEIAGVAGIEEAEAGHLTFVANVKYASAAKTTKASAVIVTTDFPEIAAATLRIKDPYLAFARAITLFYRPPAHAPGVHRTAVISESAKLGKNVHIGPYVVVGDDVEIGDNAVLLPHVVIYPGVKIGKNFFAHAHSMVREYCRLGDNVVLQNGAVVGSDGFGFARNEKGDWEKIVQSGPAVLEDDVEVQANACVDRASIGETRIGRDTKIDNLVQVGHGCEVGQHTMLCAQVGLAGSTVVKNNVILAGQVGVAGHCTIGDNVVVTAQSGVPSDIEAGKIMSGYPSIESRQWAKSVAVFNKLPELNKTIRELERRVGSIEEKSR